MKRVIAVTGPTGFVGRHLIADLRSRGYNVRILGRRANAKEIGPDAVVIGELDNPIDLPRAVEGVDTVVHCAGIAHGAGRFPDDDYRRINTDGTLKLARACQAAGVRRFVFLSSIRAQTGASASGILTETDPAVPTDAYGRSKLAAEHVLASISADWVALRPVLVFGPGVKGNMAVLVRLARTHLPLPLASLQTRRSLLSIENLAEAVRATIDAPDRLNRAFIVADDGALTYAEMIAALREGLGRNPGLFAFPPSLLFAAARMAGFASAVERLAGELVVEADALKQIGWKPLVTTRESLIRMAGAI